MKARQYSFLRWGTSCQYKIQSNNPVKILQPPECAPKIIVQHNKQRMSDINKRFSPNFRSFSAMNLATKFASNIKRKMSDQHIVQFQGRTRTRSAFLTTAASPTATASYQSNLKTRSGVLYVYSRSRRTFQVKSSISIQFYKMLNSCMH